MQRRISVLLLASLLLVATGCKKKKVVDDGGLPTVQGSGVTAVDSRPLGPFTSVDIGGALDVTINVGKNGPLEIRGDNNVFEHIPSSVTNGVLTLKPTAVFKTAQALTVTVSTERLEQVAVSVAAKVSIRGISADSFAVRAGGAAKLMLQGSARKLTVGARSVAQLDLSLLSAGEATVTASDLARVTLGYVEKLDATQRGNSIIRYAGTPEVTLHADKASHIGPTK